MGATLSDSRQAWLPAPVLPLTYFAGAHLALFMACGVLAVAPDVAGPFHYHPRMVAVTHTVTLGWITASILGALYIVAPLALGFPLQAGAGDWVTAAAFWGGTVGMVSGFWHGQYAVAGASALLVLFALLYLPLSIGLGVWVSASSASSGVTWVYGVAAIVGFVSQMVVGIQGRLLPMHAWYVAMGQHGGTPPRRSVHDLYEAPVARVIFLLWLAGVPLLAAGLGGQRDALIRAGASLLAASVVVQAAYGVRMVRRAVSAPVATS